MEFKDLGSQPGKVPVKAQSEGKPRFSLIPPEVEYALASVLTAGAKKHGDRNWEAGLGNADFYDEMMDALRRHLNADQHGHLRDDDTGMLALAHAFCCLAFLLTWRIRRGD